MIDISKITENIYVGSRIIGDHAEELRLHKFDLIISMIGQERPAECYNLPPFKTLWIKAYDTFFTPISTRKLKTGVEAALPVVRAGGKVLVYCREGKRRSVTMASAILIAMGLSKEEAAETLIKGRQVADPRRWYVRRRIASFEKYWRAHEN